MKKTNINNQIRAREVRVIHGVSGENYGVIPTEEALRIAKEENLDLIEVSPDANPPVCKIMDFGKYQYLEKKKDKENKKKSHSTEVKSIQIKVATGENDLKLKASKVSEWLKGGDRVKIELYLSGRSKYTDDKFKEERLNRIMSFIQEPFKLAEPVKKSPKGIMVILERNLSVKVAPKTDEPATENPIS